ncbi:hypothetical protein L2E82_44626 [Cichorium intybus]|uniref:Uncharacterized protein n=1 Tax=Cichorium intybus TaxID=13427 RepID=A0ACB8ZQY3_CICIN|nr:hypothetical protein L2E82_44626 [Cichorium intybus]
MVIEDLNLDQLNSGFVAVGFPKRDTDKIKEALEHTDSLLWVEYEKTKRDRDRGRLLEPLATACSMVGERKILERFHVSNRFEPHEVGIGPIPHMHRYYAH